MRWSESLYYKVAVVSLMFLTALGHIACDVKLMPFE